jgi:CheY-like chemotaxis protein
MVQGMVEQSGGRVLLRSEKDKGTTVEIWLPAADTSMSLPQYRQEQSPETATPARAVVLAVDDDPLVLENLGDMLEDLGYRVHIAATGVEARKILAGDVHVDLLLTDHAMPTMTGLQLIEEARSLRAKMPVLLASGYIEPRADEALQIPRLTKPFRQNELARAVAAATKSVDSD